MAIRILYSGFISEITGRLHEELNVDESKDKLTVSKLLKILSKKYGPRFRSEVYDPDKDELKQNIIVLLNGVNVTNNLNVEVKEGSYVTLMPPVSGGM